MHELCNDLIFKHISRNGAAAISQEEEKATSLTQKLQVGSMLQDKSRQTGRRPCLSLFPHMPQQAKDLLPLSPYSSLAPYSFFNI